VCDLVGTGGKTMTASLRGAAVRKFSQATDQHEPPPFSGADLFGQFLLTQQECACPTSWPIREHHPWLLSTHASLPVCELYDRDGALAGWIVGHLITPGGQANPSHLTLPCASEAASIESYLYTHAGRWAAIILTADVHRVYLDAAGTLATVYATTHATVASTPTLIPATHDVELMTVVDLPQQNRWYPGGLTSRINVRRLLPNHYLDLGNWSVHRHHLSEVYASVSQQSVTSHIDLIGSQIKHTIAGAATLAAPLIPLTAGRDSRVLLACARQVAPHSQFFTFAQPRPKDIKDVEISRLIARRFGLRHKLIEACSSSPASTSSWRVATGNCAGGTIARMAPSLAAFPRQHVLLPGVMGEVGRAYYWRDGDADRASIDAATLLERANLPRHPRFIEATEQWLRPMSNFRVVDILDLFFVEMEGGCWSGPQHYGIDPYVAYHLMPFVHRRIIDTALTLPDEYKRAQTLAAAICAREWRELLSIPFNELTTSLRIRRKFGQVMKRLTGQQRKAIG
jgi:hypothetical protein